MPKIWKYRKTRIAKPIPYYKIASRDIMTPQFQAIKSYRYKTCMVLTYKTDKLIYGNESKPQIYVYISMVSRFLIKKLEKSSGEKESLFNNGTDLT